MLNRFLKMFFLTRREQFVIISILCAFLVGLGVKHYRAMHAIPERSHLSSHF
jgi:hypothetical protein